MKYKGYWISNGIIYRHGLRLGDPFDTSRCSSIESAKQWIDEDIRIRKEGY